MSFQGQTIWVIGASSGIGRALAIQLAAKGATLVLSARREEELKKLQTELGAAARKAEHKIHPFDVSDLKQVEAACSTMAELKDSLSRVIFMSALYEPSSIATMDLAFMSKMVDVNIKGVIYLTSCLLPLFARQRGGRGQLALCGSVAGYTGLPNGQPYSATKAAIINFAESLHSETPDEIDIKLISPGFVQTSITEKNDFSMPMIITPQKAAAYILKGLNKKAFEIHFPKKFTLLLKLLSHLPYGLQLALTKKWGG